jgi:hypothetical protein
VFLPGILGVSRGYESFPGASHPRERQKIFPGRVLSRDTLLEANPRDVGVLEFRLAGAREPKAATVARQDMPQIPRVHTRLHRTLWPVLSGQISASNFEVYFFAHTGVDFGKLAGENSSGGTRKLLKMT